MLPMEDGDHLLLRVDCGIGGKLFDIGKFATVIYTSIRAASVKEFDRDLRKIWDDLNAIFGRLGGHRHLGCGLFFQRQGP